MRFPDPHRPVSRLPPGMRRAVRDLSSLGRTPLQRAMLLFAGGLLAFYMGQWTATDPSDRSSRNQRDIPESVTGLPLVLDGDTVDFNGVRVRLFGIDAFERDQLCEREDGSRYACGQMARESLIRAIDNAPLTCTRKDVDMYGRMVGVCRGREGDVSAWVVADGYALAYRRYSMDYVGEEDEARESRRGVWSGKFENPWDYRHNGQGKQVR